MNDECMKMKKEDVQSVITSCRKRLGKSKDYSGNLKLEEEQQPEKCCDNAPQLRGFGK